MSNRPTGITILAVLATIAGLLMLFFGGFETLMGPLIGEEIAKQGDDLAGADYGVVFTFMGVVLIALGIFQLIAAYGLFTLKSWAWMLTVVMQVLGLIVNGLKLTGPEGGAAVVSIVIAAGILYYMFRPHVKQAFGRT
jgi:uncharacterized membrane protein HdeD (DUF308 family)